MRVAQIYDATSGANAALDTGPLVYPGTADGTYGLPDALVALYEPSAAAAAGNISIIDTDFSANAAQVVAMPADALSHNFAIGQGSEAAAAGRTIGAGLPYVPKSCKFVVPAAGVGVTVHLRVYSVFYR